MLVDYDIVLDEVTAYCNNTSEINISKNRVQYSRTKHIEILHHFVSDLAEYKTIALEFVETEKTDC